MPGSIGQGNALSRAVDMPVNHSLGLNLCILGAYGEVNLPSNRVTD